jgi:CHAT domain-containing protein
LMQARATESALKQARSPRLLHVATHGFFLADTQSSPESKASADENPLLRAVWSFPEQITC